MTAIHHFWLGVSPYSAVVVSGLFPTHVLDAIQPSVAVTGGAITESPRWWDGIVGAATVSSGTLETLLVGAADVTALTTAAQPTSGTLTRLLHEVFIPAEGLATSALPNGGDLAVVVISTSIAPDSLESSALPTSGTLL